MGAVTVKHGQTIGVPGKYLTGNGIVPELFEEILWIFDTECQLF